MNYDDFILEIKRRAQERLGRLYNVSLEKVIKNNGVVKDALCMSKKEALLRPTLYLNAYYDMYQEYMTLDDIMDEILEVYEWNEGRPGITAGEFKDYDKVKERIIFKLINTERNNTLLNNVPHIFFENLAVVFCVYKEHKGESLTSLIHSDLLNYWGATEKEIYELARKNTPLLLTAAIKNMDEVMKEIAEIRLGVGYSEELIDSILQGNKNKLPMYVLSNHKSAYGASCILYDNVLKDFAEKLGCNLVILPSSIHECVLLPETEDMDYDGLREMVHMINNTELQDEDFLSNDVYIYSLEKDILTVAPNSNEEFLS